MNTKTNDDTTLTSSLAIKGNKANAGRAWAIGQFQCFQILTDSEFYAPIFWKTPVTNDSLSHFGFPVRRFAMPVNCKLY